MGWVSLGMAVLSLAREIVRYMRERQNCKNKEMAHRLLNVRERIKHARLNGSSPELEALFEDQQKQK